ncbi:MAG: IMP cyclohydrolase [Lawsonibacter sp.]|jgi:IMP cyclohydrolase
MKTLDLNEILSNHPYPGRGIVLGRTADNQKAAVAYFIMGRSENSRNRVFEETQDGIRTRAFDESKMTDPSLIIYHPVRILDDGTTIVTNGDQTDTIRDHILAGRCYRHALRTREFEPDAPNYTPRISGVVAPDGSYNLSILKSLEGDPACCCRYFYEYDKPQAGVGHFIHTYQENAEPLPSFQGEPRAVTIAATSAQDWAEQLWKHLNGDNKVSLYVSLIHLETGARDTVLVNKHG